MKIVTTMKHRFIILYTALFCAWVLPAISQTTELVPVTNTFALKNVIAVISPGNEMEGATILVENGLITAVGQNVTIPSDAQILETDSMYVYAGFIGGLSHAGVPKSEDGDDNSRQNPGFPPGNPPNAEAGITPEIRLRDVLNSDDRDLSGLRETGFAIIHSVPRGDMLPGKGSLILLAVKNKDHMLLKEDISMFSQFSPARRVYPATVIGIFAKWRELYHQSKLAQEHTAKYREYPEGLKRPSYDRAIQALIPVVENQLPVFFRTEEILDLHRALNLSEELGFRIIPSEVKQGWSLTEILKQKDIQVLLSLDLPEEEKEEKKKEPAGEKSKEETEEVTGAEEAVEEEVEEVEVDWEGEQDQQEEKGPIEKEREMLNQRIKESKAEYAAQAAVFEQNNIPFGFSILEIRTKDILPAIRRMIKSGLSEEAALSALTTNPAKIFGISSVAGTIENGKMANLVVSNKPIFDEKSQIRYMIVDGQKFEFEIKKEPAQRTGDAAASTLANIAGTWEYEIEVPGMVVDGRFEITKIDNLYNVEVSNSQNPGQSKLVAGLELYNNNLSFTVTVDNEGSQMVLDYDVDFYENSLEGSVTAGEFGTFSLSGDKIESPDNY